MSSLGPSTTSYLPLDSDAPIIFGYWQTTNRLAVAFLGLLVYDHIITLDKEVEWIWTLRWRLPKIIFIFNRYVITPLLLLACIPDVIYPLSIPFCTFHDNLWWLPLMNFSAAELLLIIRVCSLYGNRKSIIWSLGIYFVLALVTEVVLERLYNLTLHPMLFYEFLPGCFESDPDITKLREWHVWVIFLSVEGVLMLLAAYKLLSYRDQLNQTITLLARDSIAYFIIIFACLALILAFQASPNFDIDVMVPAQCLSSIAVGRMMMNIRGLIMDDPEHTIHLQTLQFVARTNPGSDTEEIALG